MQKVRPAAVSGQFYPDDANDLNSTIQIFLSKAKPGPAPKALIAPHAGYVYSGAIAASVYARLATASSSIKRVVLLGPSHRVGFQGIAASTADFFATPLGQIPLDQNALVALKDLPFVGFLDDAHKAEHSLEVHLPFLQTVLKDFTLVPLVVGDASPDQVAQVLDKLWGSDETLIVVSSDLSHFHDYLTAQHIDNETKNAIESYDYDQLSGDKACGYHPVSGLLKIAQQKNLKVETVDVRNSGDTASSKDRVVGYGAWAFYEKGQA